MSITSFFAGEASPAVLAAVQQASVAISPDISNAVAKSSPISLGDIDFDTFDVPERVRFGVRQSLTVHKLIGGGRTVDANGTDPDPISWSGLFFGEDAEPRAQRLQAMCDAAEVQTLAWGAYNFNVVVESVAFDYKTKFQITYDIVCIILSVGSATPSQPSLMQTTTADIGAATAFANGEVASGLSAASGLMSGLNTIKAATATAIGVVNTLRSVQARVELGFANADAIVTGLTNIGTGSPFQTIHALDDAASALSGMANLSVVQGFVGRAITNLHPGP